MHVVFIENMYLIQMYSKQFIFVKYISKVNKRFYSLEILPLAMLGNSSLCRFRRQIGTVFRAFHH